MVNKSALVNIINEITKCSSTPCKKTLQKLVFLIEAKHIDIGCDYGIHFYGPYSSDLDFAVRELSDEGVLQIQYTSMEHLISVVDDSLVDSYNNGTVNEIIAEFSKETPSELELIATALYVYLQNKDVNRIKNDVIKIKGNKYFDARIDNAIDKLKQTGYITA